MSQKENRLGELLHKQAAHNSSSEEGYQAYLRYLQREIAWETGQSAHRVTNWIQNKSQPSVAEAKVIADRLNLKTDDLWSL